MVASFRDLENVSNSKLTVMGIRGCVETDLIREDRERTKPRLNARKMEITA
jgi:hypothetical protein